MAPQPRDPDDAPRRPRRDAEINRERVLVAAAAAVRREGPRVPMARVAGDAGVGVGTVYRHFSSREALLAALTERAFGIVLANVRAAATSGATGVEAIAGFLEATIASRRELVLPLHGGPTDLSATAVDLRRAIGREVEALLARGREDGTVRADLAGGDVVLFGAMLAEPLPHVADWDAIARRHARIFLHGIGPGSPDVLPGRAPARPDRVVSGRNRPYRPGS